MTKLIHKTGDLFTTEARGIGHGVNTLGVMGHGIAVAFRDSFPDMYTEYRNRCTSGDLTPGGVYLYEAAKDYYIFNIATQDMPGRNARLSWLKGGVETALWMADRLEVGTLALPRIGAGIGGLDWEDVERVLREAAEDYQTDIEVWTLE